MNMDPRTRMLRSLHVLMLVTSMFAVSVLSGNEIRLINSTSRCCGRVEIQHNSQWGTVCDDHWDMDDAEVVCRQMGCGRAVSAPQSARFGQGSEPTWLDDVGCKGTENYLTQCSHPGFGVEDCGHGEDAGVVCSNVLQSPAFTQISSNSAVSPGEAVRFRCTSHNPTCISASFRLYRNGQLIKTQTAESSTTFDLTVDSSHQGRYLYSCDYSYQGSRSITSPRSSSINITLGNNEIRLINGLSRCCGRVEIQHNGQWGTVCDDHWDMDDAEVVCRQMGCGRAVSAPQSAHFGQGSEPTWLDNVGCDGTENYLTQCSHPGFGVEDCGHYKDAGVVCSNVLQSPTFTQSSSHSAVSPGEAVWFRCTSHNPTCISARFRLYRNGQSIKTQTAESSTTFDLTVESSHQGLYSYSCDYSYQGSRSVTSPRSSSINITLVNLPAPRISLSHTKEVTWGENVDITCSVQTQFTGGSLTLTQNYGSVREIKSGTSIIFSLPQVDFVHEGSYYCQYQTRVSSRDFRSPQSSSVQLSVVVNLLQPIIYLSTSDGRVHQHIQGSEVTRGYSFSIICSTRAQYPGGSFHLVFSGFKTRTQSAVNHTATFFFPEADYVHQGNYSCIYEVAVSSRTFSSPPTELLEVTVKASPAPFIGFGVAAGLLLILVPVIVFFLRRYKKQEDQTAVKMDQTCRPTNSYGTTGGRIDMDDEDYEKADSFFDQGKESDDPDEDYVNVNADVKNTAVSFAGAKTTCGINNIANEMDDGDEDYENAEEIAHQRKGSDDSDEIYTEMDTDAEKMHMDDNYEDEDIYINVN